MKEKQEMEKQEQNVSFEMVESSGHHKNKGGNPRKKQQPKQHLHLQ